MTERKPLILDNGLIKQCPLEDYVTNGIIGNGINVGKFQQEVSDVKIINFTGTNIAVSENSGEADITFSDISGFGGHKNCNPVVRCTNYYQTYLSPYYVMLPDESHLESLEDTILDITNSDHLEKENIVAISNGQSVFNFNKLKWNLLTAYQHYDIKLNGLVLPGAELLLHFENNVTDSSNNELTVTNSNVTFSSSTKKLGDYSAQFNGTSSYLTLPAANLPFLKKSEKFYFEGWIYSDSTGGQYQMVFENRDGTSANIGISLMLNITNKYIELVLSNNVTNGRYIQIRTPVDSIILNSWNYFCIQYNGNGNASGISVSIGNNPSSWVLNTYTTTSNPALTVVVNGLSTYDFNNTTTTKCIGKRSYSSTFFLKGFLDEFIIGSGNLSSTDIERHFNSGSGLVQSKKVTFTDENTVILNDSGSIEIGDVLTIQLKETASQLYYIYVTDECENYPMFAFLSEQAPNYKGYHPQQSYCNAKYVGSLYNNSSSDIKPFQKIGNMVMFYHTSGLSTFLFATITATSSESYLLQRTSEIPETTNDIIIHARSNTATTYVYNSSFGNESVDYYDSIYSKTILSFDLNGWARMKSAASSSSNIIYFVGYYEDVDNPLVKDLFLP